MNKVLGCATIGFVAAVLAVSCAKKPLTLDENTSMKTLLKASDEEIKELVLKEAAEKANVPTENISVEYILRDEKSQAIAVKVKTTNE